ncbi:MAG: TerC/Alx family metal homeostasis membrane protein [Candidatus Gracilibacteria bacterium]|jgi:tellurite resistance protein TerC
MTAQTYLWILFAFIIVGFLVFDLGFFDRKAHRIGTKSALLQSIFWVAISLVFGSLILIFIGRETAAEFFGAYVTEKMLSVDNLFVILLIFNFFKIEEEYHHKVLFWGILGAVILRGLFIGLGAVIIHQFYWILYIFGAILIYTGIRLFEDKKEEHADFQNNGVLRLAKKYLRFSINHHQGKFLIKEHEQFHFTILFMILLLIETTDIIFAVDSIPAAFSISQDPFVVFTSNIFAVMGLRALFFLVENILHRFHHLQKGLSFILVFIGVKMLITIFGIHISSIVSLMVILFALGLSLVLSVIFPKKI